jgi:hypothetical protein
MTLSAQSELQKATERLGTGNPFFEAFLSFDGDPLIPLVLWFVSFAVLLVASTWIVLFATTLYRRFERALS